MRFLGLTSLILIVFFCTGCNDAKTTNDAVAIAGGRVESVFNNPVLEMTEAARSLLVAEKLVLVQYKSDSASGKAVAYTNNSQRIEIEVRPHEKGSHVTIMTDGAGGDQISMNLLSSLRKGR